ncbi:RF-1 domain-containing protein [Mycena alexandri]|uniref:RF-1 domain-containing protein n=1 Tax=Mycena alexandri TaxID=1745969 RepID=A0AAD6X2R7_9AGAR|nr:RF-1 domain-containing protein [Mycena alexandri]
MKLFQPRTCAKFLQVFLARNAHSGSHRPIPLPPRLSTLESVQETASAREWISQFRALDIPKAAVQLSFSRSSGPGGQNVNKVNTKATLRCPIDEDWIPLWAKPELKRSPYYVSSSQAIQIVSTVHRSQSQNIDECLSKLHALLIEASSSAIKNEPSEAQKKRVEDLMRAASAKRRAEKSHRSSIKTGRKRPPD